MGTRRLSLASVFLAAVACSLAQERQVPVTLTAGRDIRVTGLTSGILVTPGFTGGQPVPHNFQGAVTIQAPRGFSRIRLEFQEFDLETSPQCSGDRLVVREGNMAPDIFCSNQRPKAYLSQSSLVNLLLVTDGLKRSRGFRIRFTATNNQDSCGNQNQYQCGSSECIPRSQVCDGKFDCADGTDEKYCLNKLWRRNLVTDVPCGSPVIQPLTAAWDRIVGGREAVPHSWPWQPSIQLAGIFPMAHFCGGALLRNDLIITAAHCVSDMRAKNLVVKFGSHNLVSDEAGVQIRSVDVIARHSRYTQNDMTHDVALLKLTLPVNFTDYVRPVCLPGPRVTLPLNTTCYSTGWGTTRGTGSSFLLKQSRLTVRDFNQSCRNILSFQPNLRPSHLVCATDDEDSSGPCHGDSGGPLVCQLGSSSAWTLVGMTSQGTQLTVTHALCAMGTGTIWSSTIANRPWIANAVRTL
ncbi:chymotrypsin B-like [Haemaphysalis longicornis]|uniref:Serine protease n=1 Tax=Haemaphysalis longicornis TaxID=44386 RepID=Q6L7Z5_HAELO|nr:serine protease [Haemaphysalis longicornis]